MTQPNAPGRPSNVQPTNLQIPGGAAIIAPVSAFPNGVPANALDRDPVSQPTDELTSSLKKGPVVIDVEQMWKLLGFNGPAVQVQDEQGRPIAIGLEDLLAGLEKHWEESQDDLNRGRIYAQELMKYSGSRRPSRSSRRSSPRAGPATTGSRSASRSSRRRSSTRPRARSRARRT